MQCIFDTKRAAEQPALMLKDAPSHFAVGPFLNFAAHNYTAARQIYFLVLAVQPANECL